MFKTSEQCRICYADSQYTFGGLYTFMAGGFGVMVAGCGSVYLAETRVSITARSTIFESITLP